MRPTVLAALAILLLAAPAGAEDRFIVSDGDTLWFTPPVQVQGTRVPAAMPGPLRAVAWRDAAELALPAARSVAENLALLPEVEVSQRQQYGAQADLAVRGSTFEQVAVLLDGFDVGDAQTGHHNLNLPLGRAEVARLEVLPGRGSALYGPNAFGGVVNVVSREPAAARGLELEGTWGEFGTAGGRAAVETGEAATPLGRTRLRAAAETFRTDGQHPGTDAEVTSVSLRGTAEGGAGRLDLWAGFSRRDFGALDFYAPFPSSERTDALFLAARLVRPLSDRVLLEPRLSLRRHRDCFTLFRDDPARYRNDHDSDRLSGALRASVDAGYGLTFLGALEAAAEDLQSTGLRGGVSGPALGDRERDRASAAGEVLGRHGAWNWSLGGRVDDWGGLGDHGAAGAAVAWRASPVVTLRGNAGTLYRLPTFTELYYEDPANLGDPDLRPETGWTWDLGLEAAQGPWRFTGTVFARFEDDLIDWVRPAADPAAPWRTANLADGETRGWTVAAAAVTPRGHRLAAHVTGLRKRVDLPEGWSGKYLSLTPRRQAVAELSLALPAGVRLTPSVRFRDRSDGVDHTVADLRVSWTREAWTWRLDLTNLRDAAYQEVPGIPMPGRMLTTTATLRY